MAIRSGSGGLKYPLPIDPSAQQSIAAASAGGSAASSAYGANRSFAANKMRVQADLANSAADRSYRAMAQMEGQRFDAEQAYYDRENRKGAQLEAQRFDAERQDKLFGQQQTLQTQAQRFAADQDVLQQTAMSDRDLRRIQAEQVAGLPEIPENAQGQTRQHLQRLRGALQELVGQNWNPNDPATRDTFDQTMKDYQSITQSIPKPNPAEEFQRDTFEANGTRYQKNQSGQYVEVPNTAQAEAAKSQQQQQVAQQKQEAARQSELEKIAKEQESVTVGDTDRTLTPKEAMEAAKKLYAEREAAGYYGPVPGQQQPGGQPAPAPGQPEQPPPPAPGQVPLPSGHPNAQPASQAGQPSPGGTHHLLPKNAGAESFDQMPKPMSAADLAALPPGTTYMTPNGEVRKKK